MIYYHCFVDGDPKLKISHSWNCCDYFVGGGFKPKILSHSWETKAYQIAGKVHRGFDCEKIPDDLVSYPNQTEMLSLS